ncbi:MAG: Fic family protein [Rickettsiales bacterium]|jgi:Fic family protein|nr:Fic family protein [Rickettsiales bacterium]
MDNLIKKISEKHNVLKRLLRENQNRKVLFGFLKTELAYTSNAIEGNTLSRRETELAINEDLTNGTKPIKDYIEARNHADAYDFIIDALGKKAPAAEKFILEIHARILSGIDRESAGFYRRVRVRISGSQVVLSNPLKVPDLMTEFGAWLQTDKTAEPLKSIMAHVKLVSIHPFIDGNGRTARLLMNYMLLAADYAPIIIRPIDRKRYLGAIESLQSGQPAEKYIKFMLSALSRSLAIAIDLLTKDAPDTKKLMTIAKFAKLSGLPVSTIRYWVGIKKLQPAGYSRNGYMLFDPKQVKEIK